MVPDSVIIVANACQVATTFISLSAYLPQWIKIIQTRSSVNISVHSWCLWFISSSFAFFYAVVQYLLNDRGWPLIISTLASLGSILFTISLIVKFRMRKA
ncbi:MAG: PQ-loop repeat-containing protein [Proteobacteria bacterium]|nr:PQ-loop repeat-containing protein [Pseudomonadota bacterium]MBU1711692.1 PQ-loop repeat-containing protein [Pseudomonadota bacterium]